MNVLICDDDLITVEQVKSYIDEYAQAHGIELNVFCYTNAQDVLDSDIRFNIAILDIEMPDTNGIQLGKQLKEKNRNIMLVFLTAYGRYIDDALDLEAARFFEKPLERNRFYLGLDKIISRIDETSVKLTVSNAQKEIVINSCDIIYVEIKSRKTRLVTTQGEYFSYKNIAFWKSKLTQSAFAQCHKSYIVNMNYIKQYQSANLTMENGDSIPISRSNKAEFKKIFMRYMEL